MPSDPPRPDAAAPRQEAPGGPAVEPHPATTPPPGLPDAAAPRRLHPISLLFGVLGVARGLILPLIFVTVLSPGQSWQGLFIVPFVLIALTTSFVRYLSYFYRLGEDELVIRQGILRRNERHIPYARIQNVDLEQNVLHRMFDVAVVRLETASGGTPEAVISVLSKTQVAEMRHRVFRDRRAGARTGGSLPADETTDRPAEEPAEETLVQTPVAELVRAGLISNRGFIVVGIAFGALAQFDFWNFDEQIELWIEDLVNRLEDSGVLEGEALPGLGGLQRETAVGENLRSHPFLIALLVLLLFVAFIAAVRVLSVIWTVVTLYGFTLRQQGNDLRARYGLFTRVTATVPRHRIQLVSTRRSLLHRAFRRAAVLLETAGGSEEEGRGGGRAARLWLAPILATERVNDLVHRVLPEIDIEAPDWRPLAPRALVRLLRRNLIVALLPTIPAVILLRGWGLLVFPLLFGWLAFLSHLYVAYTRYALLPRGVVFRSGALGHRLSVVRFGKIQGVRFSRSPFDRRHRMASVSVDTAGAGRVGHRVDIGLLDLEDARRLYRHLEREAVETDFRW